MSSTAMDMPGGDQAPLPPRELLSAPWSLASHLWSHLYGGAHDWLIVAGASVAMWVDRSQMELRAVGTILVVIGLVMKVRTEFYASRLAKMRVDAERRHDA